MTKGLVCRVPTQEEREAFIRDFPEWVSPMPERRCRCAKPTPDRKGDGYCIRCANPITTNKESGDGEV